MATLTTFLHFITIILIIFHTFFLLWYLKYQETLSHLDNYLHKIPYVYVILNLQ